MIEYKTEEEIATMKKGGEMLKSAAHDLVKCVEPGVTTEEINNKAEQFIHNSGGESSFKKVPGYFWSTCLPVNEQVVHTPPSKRQLKDGDMLTIDMGLFYGGFHVDWATTLIVGKPISKEHVKFLEAGRRALKKALTQVKKGNRIGNISLAIESEIVGSGYFILKDLTGHGVGRKLHEDPIVPGYLDRPIEKTPKLKPGMVLAIEVIYSMSTEKITDEQGSDWSIISADKSLTGCFEETIAIDQNNSFILT